MQPVSAPQGAGAADLQQLLLPVPHMPLMTLMSLSLRLHLRSSLLPLSCPMRPQVAMLNASLYCLNLGAGMWPLSLNQAWAFLTLLLLVECVLQSFVCQG